MVNLQEVGSQFYESPIFFYILFIAVKEEGKSSRGSPKSAAIQIGWSPPTLPNLCQTPPTQPVTFLVTQSVNYHFLPSNLQEPTVFMDKGPNPSYNFPTQVDTHAHGPNLVGEQHFPLSVSLTGGSSDHSSSSCLLYTSPSPRDRQKSRMPSSA